MNPQTHRRSTIKNIILYFSLFILFKKKKKLKFDKNIQIATSEFFVIFFTYNIHEYIIVEYIMIIYRAHRTDVYHLMSACNEKNKILSVHREGRQAV